MFDNDTINPRGQDCWKQMTFGYKFYFVSSLAMIIISSIFVDHPALSII